MRKDKESLAMRAVHLLEDVPYPHAHAHSAAIRSFADASFRFELDAFPRGDASKGECCRYPHKLR